MKLNKLTASVKCQTQAGVPKFYQRTQRNDTQVY